MPVDSAAGEICFSQIVEEIHTRLTTIDSGISRERGVARVVAVARLLPHFPRIERDGYLDLAALAIAVVMDVDRRARDARLRAWPPMGAS